MGKNMREMLLTLTVMYTWLTKHYQQQGNISLRSSSNSEAKASE